MNNPSSGFVKNLWCGMGKPFRNKLIRIDNFYKYNVRGNPNPFMDMRKLIQKDNPVVVDGGANNGGTVTTFKQYFPGSTILAFEPLDLGLEENTKEFDGVHIEYLALGEKNKQIEFNVTYYPDTSSIFLPNNLKDLEYLKVQDKKKVSMVSLDKWSREKHFQNIDIIKLDLQGYELNALKGAKELLSGSVKLVYVECSFREVYLNQPLFCDVYQYMKNCGFGLYNIYRESPKQPVVYVDALFVREMKYENNGTNNMAK